MSGITGLIGDEVQAKDGGKVQSSSWSQPGKVVGLYFSAHWCPPCRGFTPKLADWYNKFKKSAKGDKMEMVFVSSDRDQESFDEYYKDMPWHALPFADRERKGKLSGKFKVQGIPTLVFVEADTGKLITNNGREKVTTDPEGEDFPWYPKPLSDILSGPVLKHGDGDVAEEVDLAEAIKGKVLGIYFSAHWCPPCRGFTPELVKTYKKVKEDGKNFEIIFVSSDRDEGGFKEYWGSMPWLSIPFGDKRKNLLSDHFEVEGIPDFRILGEDLKVINSEGRGAIGADPEGKEFPWEPKPLNPLIGQTAGKINSTATLVYLTGDDKGRQGAAKDLLQSIAETYVNEFKQQSNGDIPELAFFYEVEESEDMADSLREFLKLGDAAPLLFVVNIPEQKKYVHSGDITKQSIQGLVNKFKSGSIEFGPLR